MNSSLRSAAGYAVLTFALAAPAVAVAQELAFVSSIGGDAVTLLRGEDKLRVGIQTLLLRGDRVTAPSGNFVEVTYLGDGCILRVANGRSVTVSSASPCAATDANGSEGEVQAEGPDQASTEIVPAAAQAGAARVMDATGPLARANFGQGLVELRAGMVLKLGDTVFAGQSSTITLEFTDAGCSYTLPAETYLEIGPNAPCVPAEGLAQQDTSSAAAPQTEDDDDDLALAAAVLIGGGGAAVAAFLLIGEDDDNGGGTPVTPN
jgi:hypothetical protein